MTPPGKEVPAGKYLVLARSFPSHIFIFHSSSGLALFYRARNWRIIKERGEGKTYPPYFKTVISGIAAPNGRLLLVNFST
jgi:hypothetical protein